MTGLCNNDGVVICLVKENLWPVTRSKFCMTPSWDFNHGYSLVCKKCSHFLWFMSWDKNSHEMCFNVQRDIWVVNWWKENINVGYVCLHVDGWLLLLYVPSGLVVIHSSVYKYIEQFQKVITVINITRKMVLSNNLSLCRLFALVFCLSHWNQTDPPPQAWNWELTPLCDILCKDL